MNAQLTTPQGKVLNLTTDQFHALVLSAICVEPQKLEDKGCAEYKAALIPLLDILDRELDC